MEKKKMYVAPLTKKTVVELESGIMSSSIMDPNDGRDDGVKIEGHEVGNLGDYTNIGWDNNSNNTFNNGL